MASAGDDELCQFLEWDSAFFGVPTGRVVGDTLTAERVGRIDGWCAGRGVKWLYFLARADDAGTVRVAEAARFGLVDVRLTFARDLTRGEVPGRSPLVRPFELGDLPAVRRIGRVSYTDSRFYYDGRVPREKCDELFETWSAKACTKGYESLVAEQDGEVVGYVAGDAVGNIELIGVAEAARGKGVGRALVESAVAWAAGDGWAEMTVVTQGRNVAAQRLYQRCGFVTKSVGLYYHKWYD
jgi:dTDP-4-amino-4,6-dideoxy-D-galactose acyltransferase